ncbi:MAG: cytochrome D1 domain-containing protein [Pseudomonadota bacterium]
MTLKQGLLLLAAAFLLSACGATPLRGTGDLGVVIERAGGSVLVVDTTHRSRIARIVGLGDLSHASVVYSRDQRYAYVFGRDGGLSKIDLLQGKIEKRIIQAGNSIGGAISQDGRLLAVSNYTPGGVKIFSSDSLEQIADIPAEYEDGKLSKVVGLTDAPGHRFIFSLFDAGQIWLVDMEQAKSPRITRFENAGVFPYDGLISPDGRYYLAGLFGENGLALVDLWHPENGVRRVLLEYGKDDKKLPVYKMPHLEGWAIAGDYAFIPAVGHHQVLVVDRARWEVIKRIPVKGQPVFAMARPDGRQVWVNFAFPHNRFLQVIDVKSLEPRKTLEPGEAVLHMEFAPRGEEVWVAVRDDNRVMVYDTESLTEITRLPADHPSGIFFSARAHKIGL